MTSNYSYIAVEDLQPLQNNFSVSQASKDCLIRVSQQVHTVQSFGAKKVDVFLQLI